MTSTSEFTSQNHTEETVVHPPVKYINWNVEIMNDKHYYFGFDFTFYRSHFMKNLVCSCCERHQKNKPSLADFDNMFDGIYDCEKTVRDVKCGCFCRQNSRTLCHNNAKKYKMLKDLILNAQFEIKRNTQFDECKQPFYDKNMPYFIYNEYDDTECDIRGDVIKWEIIYCVLVRIDDVVYDIQLRHSSYDEQYLDGLGVHPISGEVYAESDMYNDSLQLLQPATLDENR